MSEVTDWRVEWYNDKWIKGGWQNIYADGRMMTLEDGILALRAEYEFWYRHVGSKFPETKTQLRLHNIRTEEVIPVEVVA